MPWTPDFKLFQHASTVLPTGLMTPRPVTTTLRMVFSIGIGPPFNGEGPQTLPPKNVTSQCHRPPAAPHR